MKNMRRDELPMTENMRRAHKIRKFRTRDLIEHKRKVH